MSDSVPLVDLLRRAGLDSAGGALACSAGTDMTAVHLRNRERWTMDLPDAAGRTHRVYMKRYGPETLRQRLERLLTYGPGRSAARIELDMIHACHAAGVGTIAQAAAGEERTAPGRLGRSYIIMTAVPGEALEQAGEPFMARNAARPERVAELTRELSDLVRRFHAAGLVHRDLYTSHIFLCEPAGDDGPIELRLIDLARAFRPRFRTFRWRVKDLAQIKHSMPPAWTATQWEAFLGDYLGAEQAARRAAYERAIDAKVARIRRRGTHQDRHGLPYGFHPQEKQA